MKKLLVVIAIAVASYVAYVQQQSPAVEAPATQTSQNGATLARAIANHASKVQVQGQGRVIKVLPDDNDGSRHQRFLVRLESGETILIAHNIDLAQRVLSLKEGDLLSFAGQYEWNSKGGVVHWTHRDPSGKHAAGWLKHNGQTFQ